MKKEVVSFLVAFAAWAYGLDRQLFYPKDIVQRLRISSGGERFCSDQGEFLIDTSITYTCAPEYQHSPAIAFDGVNYFVVWADERNGNSDIYGARVTVEGVVLDPAGIPISTAPERQRSPAVAFDGTNYFVVWEDMRNAPDTADIYGARVTPAGILLDTSGIPIAVARNWQFNPAIAFDGLNYLVVWNDGRNGSYYVTDIYGARVTPAGEVLDSAGIVIAVAEDNQRDPAIAFDGTNFLIVWGDGRNNVQYYDIYGARVTPAGEVLDSGGIRISNAERDEFKPAVVFDGMNYFVVWSDCRNGSYYDIYGCRVSPSGEVLEPSGIAISRAPNDQFSPAVAFDGNNIFVMWEDGRSNNDYPDIYGCRVTRKGIVLDTWGIAVSIAPERQESPAITFGGMNCLVVWSDKRSGVFEYDIFGTMVTKEGLIVNPTGIPMATAAHPQATPVVGFDGVNYLVIWADERKGNSDIYGARVTPQGVVLDPEGFSISAAVEDQRDPAVAFDGENYLVVWTDYRNGLYNSDIYGARVAPQGVVLDTSPITISAASSGQALPAIAYDGRNYLVAWDDYRGGLNLDIYGARVTPQGAVLDTSGIAISTVSTMQYCPAVAFDGANYLVVWFEHFRGRYEYAIYGARVTPLGVPLDSLGISTPTSYQGWPAVAFDGENYLVVWVENNQGRMNISGAQVSPDGRVFGEGLVIGQDGRQSSPALAHGNGSQIFLVYQGWAGTVCGKTYNTCRIWGKFDPLIGIKEAMSMRHFSMTNATIIRNVLDIPVSSGEPGASRALFDITGRKVMELFSGANDISRVGTGVYFVVNRERETGIKKVVITR